MSKEKTSQEIWQERMALAKETYERRSKPVIAKPTKADLEEIKMLEGFGYKTEIDGVEVTIRD